MDILERVGELLVKEGVSEKSVFSIDRIVRREYGGSEQWVAKRSPKLKAMALDTFMKTGSAYQAAKVSGYSISNVYRLFKKHRGR